MLLSSAGVEAAAAPDETEEASAVIGAAGAAGEAVVVAAEAAIAGLAFMTGSHGNRRRSDRRPQSKFDFPFNSRTAYVRHQQADDRSGGVSAQCSFRRAQSCGVLLEELRGACSHSPTFTRVLSYRERAWRAKIDAFRANPLARIESGPCCVVSRRFRVASQRDGCIRAFVTPVAMCGPRSSLTSASARCMPSYTPPDEYRLPSFRLLRLLMTCTNGCAFARR